MQSSPPNGPCEASHHLSLPIDPSVNPSVNPGRVCGHFLCAACAPELASQSTNPRCPVCRQQFQPPPARPPDPREAGWMQPATGKVRKARRNHPYCHILSVFSRFIQGIYHPSVVKLEIWVHQIWRFPFGTFRSFHVFSHQNSFRMILVYLSVFP